MLHDTLHTLGHLFTIRGRHAEAQELLIAADELPEGRPPARPSEGLRSLLQRIRDAGDEAVVAEELDHLPQALGALVRTGSCSPADVADLVAATGATSRREIEDALEWSWPVTVGDDVRRRIEAAFAGCPPCVPVPLGRATHLFGSLVPVIEAACPPGCRTTASGGYRRYEPMVDELVLVVTAEEPASALARLVAAEWSGPVLHVGPGRLVVQLDGVEVTILVTAPEAQGIALLWTTGSREYVRALCETASGRGLSLSVRTIERDGRALPTPSEEAVHAALGLPDVPPELRTNRLAVERLRQTGVPALVTRRDMRGDLHMHTDWSDGRDTIDAMVAAAAALGYEYVAITDHSRSAVIARGLDADRLARQHDEVLRLREQYPAMHILHGSEVDILPDGRLDFPDEVLQALDIVLASLHDPAGQPGSTLTDRYIRAMEHPLVHVITHPTNRLVPTRAGYVLDEDRLFEAAVRTQTIVEIDGAPGHLDMDGEMASRAIAAGALLSIDSDCHRADLLGRQMQLGVGTARRGGVTAAHVANTRSLADLQVLLARKRSA
jgi:DNA polymerase (family 10)